MVKTVVVAHGGRVRAESLGHESGSTFTVELPLPDDAPGNATGELAGIRVLLVDDDDDMRFAARMVLELHGAEVTAVASAAAALAALEGSRPHVLLSDISMPGDSGYDSHAANRRTRRRAARRCPHGVRAQGGPSARSRCRLPDASREALRRAGARHGGRNAHRAKDRERPHRAPDHGDGFGRGQSIAPMRNTGRPLGRGTRHDARRVGCERIRTMRMANAASRAERSTGFVDHGPVVRSLRLGTALALARGPKNESSNDKESPCKAH